MTSIVDRPHTGIGAPVDRVDGSAKVQGRALYANDAPIRPAAHAAFVRASIAAGRITSIDLEAAKAVPGVLRIYTYENRPTMALPASDFAKGLAVAENLTPLSSDEIFYQGQYVALVVAETIEAARAAAGLVCVMYDKGTPKIDLAVELPNATLPEQSFGTPLQAQRGDFDAAYAAAEVRVDATYVTPQANHNPMETHATTASWDGDKLTVWDSTQWVIGSRNVIAAALDVPIENVRVICPFVGGGFGAKGFAWGHSALTAAVARDLGRPVKLSLGRDEMFTGVGHRARTEQHIRLGARRDGTITAQNHDTVTHTSMVGDFVESAGKSTMMMYAADSAVRMSHELVRLNVGTPNPMRAPGEAPGSFALESAIDELAYALGMDPIELRNKNHTDRDPAHDLPWSSKHLTECFTVGAERFGWAKRTPAPRSMREGRELIGYGVAAATYPAMAIPASARATADAKGHVTVASATHDLGTGMYTIMTQTASERLGIPIEDVTAQLGDTAFPQAPVAGGSWSTASVLPAIQAACDALRAKLDAIADAHNLPRESAIGAIVRASGASVVTVEADAKQNSEEGRFSAQSFGAQFAEVRYDEDLGRLRVARVTGVYDCGRVINPKTARSQMVGGIVWGIGMALMEETVIDKRTGTIVTDNLADYHVPVNADVPPLDIHFVEYPDYTFSSMGLRGVGEIGITGVAAAIANAVYHATGKRVRDLPILPEKLL
jgi:xanthine dehydrogenase YagR molybdenum-binding subunit